MKKNWSDAKCTCGCEDLTVMKLDFNNLKVVFGCLNCGSKHTYSLDDASCGPSNPNFFEDFHANFTVGSLICVKKGPKNYKSIF
jgi:hypothetical protein